jgi:hypothetical protein
MTGRDVLKLLKANGWELDRVRGECDHFGTGARLARRSERDSARNPQGGWDSMICYPAVIEYDREDDAYHVSFPTCPDA